MKEGDMGKISEGDVIVIWTEREGKRKKIKLSGGNKE